MKIGDPQPGAEGNPAGEGTPPEGAPAPKPTPPEAKPEPKDDEGLDVSKLDPKVQDMIKNLRKENADARKKNKDLSGGYEKLKGALVEAGFLESDDATPEEKLKNVSTQFESAVTENAILEAAMDNGVGKEDLKYFKFLVSEEIAKLADDQELSEDQIAAIAKEAKGRKSAGGTTSVEGKQNPVPGEVGGVTLEQFLVMNIGQKSELWKKQPETYNSLFAEAKKLGKIK